MPMRTHYCGEVNETLVGSTVSVAGWVHRRRDHGGVIFVDLRDREGLLQVVFDPDAAEVFAEAERLRSEWVRQGHRQGAAAPGRHRQRQPRLGPGGTAGARDRDAEPLRADPVPARRGRQRRDAAQVPLHRPAPRRDAEAPAAASPRSRAPCATTSTGTGSSTSKRRCSPRRRRKARATTWCRAAPSRASSSRCRSRRRSSSSC